VKLLLLTVGARAPAWSVDACREYTDRVARFVAWGEAAVKPEAFKGDVDAVRRAEASRLLAQVTPRDRLVVLDERGEAPDSHAFSRLVVEGLAAEGRLVFALGGAYGHDASVRARAWKVVRLSNAVLNHEVARIVLCEQIYRAFTLHKGIPYHH
jgi:23S rRNA (pseudouridine1915-N3)-methyltransferase